LRKSTLPAQGTASERYAFETSFPHWTVNALRFQVSNADILGQLTIAKAESAADIIVAKGAC